MYNDFIKILSVPEMLKMKYERNVLKLKEYFVSELKKNNVEERLVYHKYMS